MWAARIGVTAEQLSVCQYFNREKVCPLIHMSCLERNFQTKLKFYWANQGQVGISLLYNDWYIPPGCTNLLAY